MLTIRLDSPVALAEQVRLGIRQAIASSELEPGDALPTVRQLAGDLGINFNTVARAYRELERDGLVVSRRGRGTVVASPGEVANSRSPVGEAPITEGLRRTLADARLAGLAPNALRELFEREMKEFWPQEEET